MVDPRGLEFREAGSIPAALTKFKFVVAGTDGSAT